jgi:hypothetical protein
MELLIPGLVLVAIMVWASTRIKRNAAAAFDAERVETGDFVLEKPEGFLHVLNDNTGLLFRAYSKEFGTVGQSDLRQATIEVERHRGTEIDALRTAISEASESFEAETSYMDAGEKAAIARSVSVRDGAEYSNVHKFITRGKDVIEARGQVLSEFKDAFLPKIESMLETLRVK